MKKILFLLAVCADPAPGPDGARPHGLLVDAQGRYRYLGSHNGRPGVIE